MRFIKNIFVFAAILIPFMASAQFYVTGDDPGRLKWNYIDTENYKVIYPQGSDSLAKVYCRNLEKYRIPYFLIHLLTIQYFYLFFVCN